MIIRVRVVLRRTPQETSQETLPKKPSRPEKVTPNSPSQDYSHPDDHNLRTYDMTPGFKPFTKF